MLPWLPWIVVMVITIDSSVRRAADCSYQIWLVIIKEQLIRHNTKVANYYFSVIEDVVNFYSTEKTFKLLW